MLLIVEIPTQLEVVTHLPWQQSPGKTCWGRHSKVLSIPWYSGMSRRSLLSESRSRRCDSAPDCTGSRSSVYKKGEKKCYTDRRSDNSSSHLHTSVHFSWVHRTTLKLGPGSANCTTSCFLSHGHHTFAQKDLKVCTAHHVRRYLLNVATCQQTLKTCGTYRYCLTHSLQSAGVHLQ